jgi:hypothetical protein
MLNHLLDKTDKGREEIASRMYHLAPRLRSLLVLVDGKHSTLDLLGKVSGLGLTGENVNELIEGGFIQIIINQSAAASTPADSAASDGKETSAATAQDKPIPEGILAEGETQFQALYHFYTETIKSTIGLRGFGLQLKVERVNTIDDFRELRQPYLEAVLKAKGNEIAHSLRTRLDELLNLGQTPPP